MVQLLCHPNAIHYAWWDTRCLSQLFNVAKVQLWAAEKPFSSQCGWRETIGFAPFYQRNIFPAAGVVVDCWVKYHILHSIYGSHVFCFVSSHFYCFVCSHFCPVFFFLTRISLKIITSIVFVPNFLPFHTCAYIFSGSIFTVKIHIIRVQTLISILQALNLLSVLSNE